MKEFLKWLNIPKRQQKAFCNDLLKALQGDFWKVHFEFKGR